MGMLSEDLALVSVNTSQWHRDQRFIGLTHKSMAIESMGVANNF